MRLGREWVCSAANMGRRQITGYGSRRHPPHSGRVVVDNGLWYGFRNVSMDECRILRESMVISSSIMLMARVQSVFCVCSSFYFHRIKLRFDMVASSFAGSFRFVDVQVFIQMLHTMKLTSNMHRMRKEKPKKLQICYNSAKRDLIPHSRWTLENITAMCRLKRNQAFDLKRTNYKKYFSKYLSY